MLANGNRISAQLPEPKSRSAESGEQIEQVLKVAQNFISERPVICLAGAFAMGVLIACFLKRTR